MIITTTSIESGSSFGLLLLLLLSHDDIAQHELKKTKRVGEEILRNVNLLFLELNATFILCGHKSNMHL